MRHLLSRRSLLAALVPALFMAPAAAQSLSTITFDRGSDSATVEGAVTGNGYVDYRLGAGAGQTMTVTLAVTGTNGHGSAYFNILPPGSDGAAIFIGSMSPDRHGEVDLPEDGDYTIRVYLMGNDKDADRTVDYRLTATIR